MKRYSRPVAASASAVFLACLASVAGAAPATLPDTAAGRLAGELIHHVNAGNPDQMRRWAPTILSADIAPPEQAGFVQKLVVATRDSGGVDVHDVRTHPRQPGLLQVAVKGRRTGRHALFVMEADPAKPDKLALADMVGMQDPSLYAAWPKGPVSQAELQRLINTTLDRLAQADDFSGCLSVSDGKKTIVDECRGLAERNFGVANDHRTRFHIGSLTKMFTAVAVAQLVEAGKLSWDSTLAQLVPEYPDQATARNITVWQLLHHTSGLGDFFVPEFFQNREQYVDPQDFLDLIARQPVLSEPGKQWNYSNSGYVLLGRIIENVSGESYFDYVQQRVFAPAGMADSGFDAIEDITPNLSVGYFRDGPLAAERKAAWMKLPVKGVPAGSSYSTNADLLRFSRALREGELVKPATLAKMFDDPVPAGPGGYAAGFGERLSHGRHIRGHTGGIEGTTANLAIVWETGAAVALTSNEGPAENWLLAERIADLLAAGTVKP
ncbi:serine hydrolase domain-containing protein [Lysobacter korlensis]|uniref:Serine hydrolase domain-containing protein n=1 Tax=Lysobacter korlensis TaxID=553636 RepID=A0ABV6RUI4_9GAMM